MGREESLDEVLVILIVCGGCVGKSLVRVIK